MPLPAPPPRTWPAPPATTRQVTGLGEGPHIIVVHARDKVGHVDETGASANVTVDFTPPTSVVQGARTGYVRPSNARFDVAGTDNFSQPSKLKFNTTLTGPACAATSETFAPMAQVDLTGCTSVPA